MTRRTRSDPQGSSWRGRTAEHFVTRGAAVRHGEGGWYATVGKRVRGPLSSLSAAMDAADEMLAEAGRLTENSAA